MAHGVLETQSVKGGNVLGRGMVVVRIVAVLFLLVLLVQSPISALGLSIDGGVAGKRERVGRTPMPTRYLLLARPPTNQRHRHRRPSRAHDDNHLAAARLPSSPLLPPSLPTASRHQHHPPGLSRARERRERKREQSVVSS